MLKINISRNIGFCFGVKRAIDKAETLLKNDENVYITGDLIHNEEEMERLEKMGLKVLDINSKWPDLSHSTVLIRAHGVPLGVLDKLKASANKIVDAVCPVVNKVANLIKEEREREFEIFLYGRQGHAEVEYLKSFVDEVKVINWDSIPTLIPESKKIALFSQTTMDIDGFKKMAEYLLDSFREFSDFHIHNTICSVTIEREREVKRLADSNDVCIVVGGKKSSNTKKLYEIAKRINQNSYMILNESEIQLEWFLSAKSVGICSGTSTPQKAIERVVKRIKNFKN